MHSLNIKNIVLVVVVGACASLGTGCYADAQVEPVSAHGYDPQYYEGRVVYYDGNARPFYYNGGSVSYVPSESPHYNGYVSHYRTNAPAYARWHASYGDRYKTYHRR